MANAVFLDTVGLLGALNKDDDLHEAAAVVLRSLEETGRLIVTTTLVLAEVGNGLARASLRADAGGGDRTSRYGRAFWRLVAASGTEPRTGPRQRQGGTPRVGVLCRPAGG